MVRERERAERREEMERKREERREGRERERKRSERREGRERQQSFGKYARSLYHHRHSVFRSHERHRPGTTTASLLYYLNT